MFVIVSPSRREITVPAGARERDVYSRLKEAWYLDDDLIRYPWPYDSDHLVALTGHMPTDESGLHPDSPELEEVIRLSRDESFWAWGDS